MKRLCKIVMLSFALAAAVELTGCATLPSPEVMKTATQGFTLPVQPKEGKAIIYVVRPSSLGALIRFNVFVDDKEDASEVGYTRGAQYIYFNVDPGTHHIFSKAENWAQLDVEVKSGDVVYLQQDPAMGILIARNDLLRIEDVPGKYHVKNLSLGTLKKEEK